MFDVTITEGYGLLQVSVTAPEGLVDRSDVYGWTLPHTKRALANRLARGIKAGKVLTNAVVKTDVNGKTYLSAESQVLGRHMNADLKRLGF